MPQNPPPHLIIVQAFGPNNFKYTDFATGLDASKYLIPKGHQLSWIVTYPNPIGYRIDFGGQGTPFPDSSIVVPDGRISTPETVVNVP
jgi:hypothetical protein